MTSDICEPQQWNALLRGGRGPNSAADASNARRIEQPRATRL